MRAVTIGEIERCIYDLEKHFNVDFEGLTNRECVDKLRELCPLLHSDEELKEASNHILDGVVEEYGFKGLRVWYSVCMRGIISKNVLIERKYNKLIDEINGWINEYLQLNHFSLKLDVCLLSMFFKELYTSKYPVFDVEDIGFVDLYSLMRTIHLSNYNPIVIKELESNVEIALLMQGDNYYTNKDLTDILILQELYEFVAEEMGGEDVFEGHNLFYDYDGYGGIILNI